MTTGLQTTELQTCFNVYSKLRTEMGRWLKQSMLLDPLIHQSFEQQAPDPVCLPHHLC